MEYMSLLEVAAYFVYSTSMIILGISINNKLYKNVRNEEHLEKGKIIQRIMKTHSLVQCIAWPCLIVMAFILKINKHLRLDIIPRSSAGYIIGFIRFLSTLNGCYGGFNSLIMAISRYVCVVHSNFVDNYGVKKVRKYLIGSSIGIPFLLAVLTEALVPIESIWEVLFLPDNDTVHKRQIYDKNLLNESMAPQIPLSPIYHVTNIYFPSKIAYILQLVQAASMLLIHSNILEGIIYLHIYIQYKRTQLKTSVKDLLSDDSQIRRHRRFTISIQMTVTSWSLELATGVITLINSFIFAHDASLEISTQILVAIHLFLYFVVIPGSYLLSTQVYKNKVFDMGWYIVLPSWKNRRAVAPGSVDEIQSNALNDAQSLKEENQSESVSNPKTFQNKTADKVPTISGNVNLETSYMVF